MSYRDVILADSPVGYWRLGERPYSDVLLALGPLGYWRLGEPSGTNANDLGSGNNDGTYFGSPTLGVSTPVPDGKAVQTNGTNQYVTAALDLSGTDQISLSFWMWWDAFANNDNLAMEYTANISAGAGFYIDPNGFTGSFHVGMGKGDGNLWIDKFTRPSAATWHHYLFTMNRATLLNVPYVDGVPQAITTHIHNGGVYGNYANSTLNFMSRGGASLFGAGRLSEVAIFDYILTEAQAAAIYDQGQGVVADEIGLNPGSYANPPVLGVAGALAGDSDTAVSFPTGVEFVSIPDSATLDLGDGPFSWECWVKRLALNPGYSVVMMSKGTQGRIFFDADQITVTVEIGSFVAYEAGYTSDIGNWHHVVWTRAAVGTGNTVIYKDGEAVDLVEDSIDDVAVSSSEPLVLGMLYDGFNSPLLGVLDEVAIYDYVLSPAQVLAHYEAATPAETGVPVLILGGL